MPSFIWDRDPQEAMDNPYEYEAQEQFVREAESILNLFSNELGKFDMKFTVDDRSLEKAIWMLQNDALDSLKDILERRLQSIVFRKGLARSMKQSRQFIVHGHVMVDGKKLTSPGYLVPKAVEGSISFVPRSSLTDEMHPERVQVEKLAKKPEEKADKKTEKKAENKPVKKKETKKEKPKKETKPKEDKKEVKEK